VRISGLADTEELISFQEMLGLLVGQDAGVVVIDGIGGSGKTLAAKAAYQEAMTSNIFNAYIWVSLSISCSLRQCINKIAASLSSGVRDNLSVERVKTGSTRHTPNASPKREYSAKSARFSSSVPVFPHPSSPMSHTPYQQPARGTHMSPSLPLLSFL
jgi:hypothetical protein